MMVHDAGLGVGAKWELADLHLMSCLLGLGFGQAYAADLRLAVGAAGDAVLVDGLGRLACNARNRHNAAHAGHMGKLRQSGNDVANRVDALFTRFHPLIYVDESSLRLDARYLFHSDFFGVRPPAYGDQHPFRLQALLFFALWREDHGHAVFGFLYFFYLSIDEAVDALLL